MIVLFYTAVKTKQLYLKIRIYLGEIISHKGDVLSQERLTGLALLHSVVIKTEPISTNYLIIFIYNGVKTI